MELDRCHLHYLEPLPVMLPGKCIVYENPPKPEVLYSVVRHTELPFGDGVTAVERE